MSDNIDWSEAPEGTTHTAQDSAGRWRWFKTNPASHDTLHICTGEPTEGFPANLTLKPRPKRPDRIDPKVQPWHSDDDALQDFATTQSRRLAQCRAAGRSGWDDPEQCPPQRLAEGLVRAVRAGKLVDVGNYAMMLWKRAEAEGWASQAPAAWLTVALGHQGTPSLSDFIVVQPKAEPTEWDGTGLPPVGTVCEYRDALLNWHEVEIFGIDKAQRRIFASPWMTVPYAACSAPECFRPILTPEQRAAKERDDAVAAMLKVLESNSSMQVSDVMGSLYDAGWRKTEGE